MTLDPVSSVSPNLLGGETSSRVEPEPEPEPTQPSCRLPRRSTLEADEKAGLQRESEDKA